MVRLDRRTLILFCAYCESFTSKPTEEGVPGYDVNRGCKPTYSGHEVTGENFLAVLKGDNKTTGTVSTMHTVLQHVCLNITLQVADRLD